MYLGLEDPCIAFWPNNGLSSYDVLKEIRKQGGDSAWYFYDDLDVDGCIVVRPFDSPFSWMYNIEKNIAVLFYYGDKRQKPGTKEWLIDLASRSRLTSERLATYAGITKRAARGMIKKMFDKGKIIHIDYERRGAREMPIYGMPFKNDPYCRKDIKND